MDIPSFYSVACQNIEASSDTEEVYYPFLKYILSRVYDSVSLNRR